MVRGQAWWSPGFKMGVEYSTARDEAVPALPHTHAEYVFVLCLAGRMEWTCGGNRQSLEAGETLVHNPGELHQGCCGGEAAEGITLIVSPSSVADLAARMHISSDPIPGSIAFRRKTRAGDPGVVLQMIAEMERSATGCEVMMEALSVQILVRLLRDCLMPSYLAPKPRLPPQLPAWESIQAMRYMSRHGMQDFSLSALCAHLGTSSSRFIPLFRNSTRLNPRTYFDRVLVLRAQKLLEDRRRSVKDVAYELGFRTPSHFCRLFHSVTGTTPKMFQLMHTESVVSLTSYRADAVPSITLCEREPITPDYQLSSTNIRR